MNSLTKLMYSIHRVTGAIMCIIFFLWFSSAFVMMYHRFPKVSDKEKLDKQELLSVDTDSLKELSSIIPSLQGKVKIKKISLNRESGKTLFNIETKKKDYKITENGSVVNDITTKERLLSIAHLWNGNSIEKIDTLQELDQWIPFEALKKEMPIYRISFSDDNKSQLYIGSKKGDVLQYTDKENRFWAWVGAIPHWAYFSWLRQNTELWKEVIVVLTSLGCIMLLAGIWITIDVWRKTHRGKGKNRFSPYRKKWYHWHYISGIFFGLFVLTFTFSGMMSVIDFSNFIQKSSFKIKPTRFLKGNDIDISDFKLDYRKVIKENPDLKRIEWNYFHNHPYYMAKTQNNEFYYDASDTVANKLLLSEKEIESAVIELYKKNNSIKNPKLSIVMINDFETYYRDMSKMYGGRSQLPVWKVEVSDNDNSLFYINPKTANVRYEDTNSKIRYWGYTALHRMRLPGLNSNALLRKSILWVLLIGGSIVSISGVVLSIKYLIRKSRKKLHNT